MVVQHLARLRTFGIAELSEKTRKHAQPTGSQREIFGRRQRSTGAGVRRWGWKHHVITSHLPSSSPCCHSFAASSVCHSSPTAPSRQLYRSATLSLSAIPRCCSQSRHLLLDRPSPCTAPGAYDRSLSAHPQLHRRETTKEQAKEAERSEVWKAVLKDRLRPRRA